MVPRAGSGATRSDAGPYCQAGDGSWEGHSRSDEDRREAFAPRLWHGVWKKMSKMHCTAGMIASLCVAGAAGAQWLPRTQVTRADRLAAAPSGPLAASAMPLRPLWVKNEQTGQVLRADRFTFHDRADPPVTAFDNYSAPNAKSGININWSYPEAYTNKDFVPPNNQPPISFSAINIASDPTDLSDPTLRAADEKLSIIVEPWEAASWPDNDRNVPMKLTDYSSVVSSYSEEFEVRVCRVYFLALQDVNLPFDPVFNKYQTEVTLQFAFLSFPFLQIESPFTFDLTDFDPPITTKGKGVILTHWLQLAEPPPCYPDQNGDTIVDDADFSMFAVQYNVLDCNDPEMPFGCVGDLNFDGLVDDVDFSMFVVAYDNVLCPEGSVVRKVYAPLAGGRFKWNTTTNTPIGVPVSNR